VSSLAAAQRLNDDETIRFRSLKCAPNHCDSTLLISTNGSGDFKPRRLSLFASFTDPGQT